MAPATQSVVRTAASRRAPVRRDPPSIANRRSETTPKTLVLRATAGDKRAFSFIYRTYAPTVYAYFAYRVDDQSVAEDLTADVFVKALRKVSDFRWKGVDFAGWLLRIARNTLLDYRKSADFRHEVVAFEGRDPRFEETAPGSDTEALARLDREAVIRAVRLLRPEHQEVICLRFLQGMSTAEVAAVMQKSEGAVRVLQFRALKALHRRVRSAFEDGPIPVPAPKQVAR